jgi:Fe2+ transport system protein B
MEATLSQQRGDATLEQRIDKMHGRDRAGLVIFVAVLWCTMVFALVTIWPYISVPAIRIILTTACGLVLTCQHCGHRAMLRTTSKTSISFTGSTSSISTRCAGVAR